MWKSGLSMVKKISSPHQGAWKKSVPPHPNTIGGKSCRHAAYMAHQIWKQFWWNIAFELNLCCTCTVSTDTGCRFIHLCWLYSLQQGFWAKDATELFSGASQILSRQKSNLFEMDLWLGLEFDNILDALKPSFLPQNIYQVIDITGCNHSKQLHGSNAFRFLIYTRVYFCG